MSLPGMWACSHETTGKVLCSSFLTCRIPIRFLRPPTGRSAKHTQKQKKKEKTYLSCHKSLCNFLFSAFGEDAIPIQLPPKFRALVQLERITFRAVYLLYKLFFFDCSESDTFLKNYTILFRFFTSPVLGG